MGWLSDHIAGFRGAAIDKLVRLIVSQWVIEVRVGLDCPSDGITLSELEATESVCDDFTPCCAAELSCCISHTLLDCVEVFDLLISLLLERLLE